MRVLKLIFNVMLMSGCAYPKKTIFFTNVENSTSKAVAYLYRLPTSIDSLNPEIPTFYINDKEFGKLSIGGYYRVTIEPGPLKIGYSEPFMGFMSWKGPLELVTTAKANQVYFVKFSIKSILKSRIYFSYQTLRV